MTSSWRVFCPLPSTCWWLSGSSSWHAWLPPGQSHLTLRRTVQQHPDNRLVSSFIWIVSLNSVFYRGCESLLLFAACTTARGLVVPGGNSRWLGACVCLLVVSKGTPSSLEMPPQAQSIHTPAETHFVGHETPTKS